MPQKVAPKPRANPKKNNTALIVGAGIVALVVVALLVLLNMNLDTHAAGPIQGTAGKTWGKLDAPVTIDEYFDFQCPVCGHADGVMQQLAPGYFDTGKAKLVAHNFAFIGQESHWAAEAAECAGEQGKFWDYANYLLTHQAGENVGTFKLDNLKGFAQKLGLDAAKFNACVDSGKYTQAVNQETRQGETLGVRATPTFFVNGQKIEGLLSVQQFSQLIDSLQK